MNRRIVVTAAVTISVLASSARVSAIDLPDIPNPLPPIKRGIERGINAFKDSLPKRDEKNEGFHLDTVDDPNLPKRQKFGAPSPSSKINEIPRQEPKPDRNPAESVQTKPINPRVQQSEVPVAETAKPGKLQVELGPAALRPFERFLRTQRLDGELGPTVNLDPEVVERLLDLDLGELAIDQRWPTDKFDLGNLGPLQAYPTFEEYQQKFDEHRTLQVQEQLNEFGYDIDIDGDYGRETHAAIVDHFESLDLGTEHNPGSLNNLVDSQPEGTEKKRLAYEIGRHGAQHAKFESFSDLWSYWTSGDSVINASPPNQEQLTNNAIKTMPWHSWTFAADEIGRLQERLNAAGGYDLIVDQKPGPNTYAALVDFQKENGLTAVGDVGPETLGRLAELETEAEALRQVAQDIAEARVLKAGPDAHIINPRTGSEFTDAEVGELLRVRAEDEERRTGELSDLAGELLRIEEAAVLWVARENTASWRRGEGGDGYAIGMSRYLAYEVEMLRLKDPARAAILEDEIASRLDPDTAFLVRSYVSGARRFFSEQQIKEQERAADALLVSYGLPEGTGDIVLSQERLDAAVDDILEHAQFEGANSLRIFDIHEIAYQLDKLAKVDAVLAIAAKRQLVELRLTPGQVVEVNRLLGGGATSSDLIISAGNHPTDTAEGAAKGYVNSRAEEVELASILIRYPVDLPRFEYESLAQRGGAELVFIAEITSGAKGLVKLADNLIIAGGRRIFVKKGDELAEVAGRKGDTFGTTRPTTVPGRGLARIPNARDEARLYRDEIIEAIPKKKRPHVVAVAVDRMTGRVFYGQSSELTVRPRALQDAFPDVSLAIKGDGSVRPIENCAEVPACASAIANGGRLKDLEVAAIEVERGIDKPFCINCIRWVENTYSVRARSIRENIFHSESP